MFAKLLPGGSDPFQPFSVVMASPSGTCTQCGLRGRHANQGECIAALRDRIAVLEIKTQVMKIRKRKRRAGCAQSAQAGGS